MSENSEAIRLLLNSDSLSENLSSWEVDFLDSIQHKADRLSPNQQKKLDEISENAFKK